MGGGGTFGAHTSKDRYGPRGASMRIWIRYEQIQWWIKRWLFVLIERKFQFIYVFMTHNKIDRLALDADRGKNTDDGKMAIEWPSYRPHKAFNPHFLAWMCSSKYDNYGLQQSLRSMRVIILKTTNFVSARMWRPVKRLTNSTRSTGTKIEVHVYKASEYCPLAIPSHKNQQTHHQLNDGLDRTLEVLTICHSGERETAIVGMSQKAMHARCILADPRW